MMELLSPAGSFESLVAAVQNGADSVYFGGRQFHARRNAQNFDGDRLREAVDYCHLHGVKAYITLNILLLDKELGQALSYAGELYEMGADALIVQDLGLAALLRAALPGFALHASTQLGIHNRQQAEMAAGLGFCRAVLARETPLSDIRTLCKGPMEIEVFAHGAMCASFSGGCLFSSMTGGRSGNRGTCAQPCRQKYSAAGREGYFLSMKDLMLIEHLRPLRDAGVRCIKLEGRMKRPEYVAVVTRAYRKALDGQTELAEEILGLKRIFHRGGFSTGYLFGNQGLIAPERPNHWGEEVGRVLRADARGAQVELRLPLHRGDGVEFLGGEAHGGGVVPCDAQTRIRLTGGGHAGDTVFRTTNAPQLEAARQSYAGDTRRLRVDGELTLLPGRSATLTLTDEQGRQASCEGAIVQEAQRLPDAARARGQIEKLGDTPFVLGNLQVRAEGYLSAKELNALRRETAEKLMRTLCARRTAPAPVIPDLPPRPAAVPGLCVKVRGEAQAYAALEEGVDELQLAPARYDPAMIARVAAARGAAKLLLTLPPVTTEDDMRLLACILDQVRNHLDGCVAGNMGQLALMRGFERRVADPVPAPMNGFAAEQWLVLGFTRVELSAELTKPQMRDIIRSRRAVGVTLYGREPLMFLRQHADEWPRWLTDRQGRKFLLSKMRASACTTVLLNDRITDHRSKARLLPPVWIRLVFHDESPEDAARCIAQMKAALRGEPIPEIPGTTAGHWSKGVE